MGNQYEMEVTLRVPRTKAGAQTLANLVEYCENEAEFLEGIPTNKDNEPVLRELSSNLKDVAACLSKGLAALMRERTRQGRTG